MTQWQRTFTREPPKTKAELREMLTEAVRNTQPEPKPPPKAERDRGQAPGSKALAKGWKIALVTPIAVSSANTQKIEKHAHESTEMRGGKRLPF
jgi:hypothetical protein